MYKCVNQCRRYNYLMVMTIIKENTKQGRLRLKERCGVLGRWKVEKSATKQYNWMVRRREKAKDNLVEYWVIIIIGHSRARDMMLVLLALLEGNESWINGLRNVVTDAHNNPTMNQRITEIMKRSCVFWFQEVFIHVKLMRIKHLNFKIW